MATLEAAATQDPTNQLGSRAAWVRWWLAGTRLDWGFVVLSAALIGAGYYQSWVTRNTFPNVPSWASIPPQAAWLALTLLILINLFWGLVNLLPVYPLDGGQISRDVCSGLWPEGGVRFSLGLSTFVAGVIAAHALALR